MANQYLKVRLAKDGGGFHTRATNVEATTARFWADEGRCQIVDDKPATPAAKTPEPAPAEEVPAATKPPKKSVSKD